MPWICVGDGCSIGAITVSIGPSTPSVMACCNAAVTELKAVSAFWISPCTLPMLALKLVGLRGLARILRQQCRRGGSSGRQVDALTGSNLLPSVCICCCV